MRILLKDALQAQHYIFKIEVFSGIAG